jgi:hypothetical protein
MVMVAGHQVLAALQACEDRRQPARLAPVGEVAEVPDVVVKADDRIPVDDHGLVHLCDGPERTFAQTDNPGMAKVLIGGEVDTRHRRSPISIVYSGIAGRPSYSASLG